MDMLVVRFHRILLVCVWYGIYHVSVLYLRDVCSQTTVQVNFSEPLAL